MMDWGGIQDEMGGVKTGPGVICDGDRRDPRWRLEGFEMEI